MNGLPWTQSADEQKEPTAPEHGSIVYKRGQVDEAQRGAHLERHQHVHGEYQSRGQLSESGKEIVRLASPAAA